MYFDYYQSMFLFLFYYYIKGAIITGWQDKYDEEYAFTEENGVHSVVFNDKDQNVKYNIVLKNNTKRDISLKDIVLPEAPEEFFKYEFVKFIV